MKNKSINRTFEALRIGESLQFVKVQESTAGNFTTVVGKSRSTFYQTENMLCVDFYKHVSRIVTKYDI
ncbi:hypothetical protein [Chryseolinea sp. H1M3-3]|uniref:hypothetical protein n=1 Tax=Chryseolinea sp. H1M3-3 TaxID=3034144 RepID=UPI0023EB1307|nr:hypothetical protein [Chryseolinea sp. H1M3-3]